MLFVLSNLDHLANDGTLNDSDLTTTIKGHGDSMNISAFTSRINTANVKDMIEKSLLRFVADDSSDGRLLFDLALSSGVDVLPLDHGRKVAKTRCPFNRNKKGWLTVIDLPFAELGDGKKEYLISPHTLKTIRMDTNCSISVFGVPHFAGPVKLCPPYILLYSQRLSGINAAYDQLMRHCSAPDDLCVQAIVLGKSRAKSSG